MEELTYELGTDEVAARLGLSPRHVRRLGQASILKGKIQTTQNGKQWFFNEEDVEAFRRAREQLIAKAERHQLARESYGHVTEDVRGQPRSSEDMSGEGRSPSMDDVTRVTLAEKMLAEERAEHAKTKEKVDSLQGQLLDESKKSARLEGEKEGFQAGYQKVIDEQQKFIGMLAERLKLRMPSTSDDSGHVTEDVPGRPRTPGHVVSEPYMSDPAQPLDEPEEADEIAYKEPSEGNADPGATAHR